MDELEISSQPQEYEHPLPSSYSSLSFSLYGNLIKSKQTFLLIYTTIFAYLISAWPVEFLPFDFLLIIVGVFLAVSGSTLLNMYIDRDIDALMERTKDRPLPSGKIPPSTVLKHGILFTTAGILLVGVINILTMIVVFFGFFFDVVVYSLLLKRRTRFSIIFGGIAGGLPAVAGRTAVVGIIDLAAILMWLFVLCWIPLHLLTLSLLPKNLEGYKKANIPMWPVVSSQTQTINVITSSAILSALIIVLTGISLNINTFALLPLIIFCSFILLQAFANLREPSHKRTFKIFKLASIFMAFAFFWLFVGVVITSFLP